MSPRAKPKPHERIPSEAERRARARSLKANPELAEAYGIGEDPPRELVRVDSLPDPPATEVIEAAAPRHRRQPSTNVNVDEAVLNILRDEMDELAVRLDRFGVAFTP